MDKQTRKLMFSSKRQDWATPQHVFDELNLEFNFTLDPCCTEKTTKCDKYFTPKEDGLKQNWGGECVLLILHSGENKQHGLKKVMRKV